MAANFGTFKTTPTGSPLTIPADFRHLNEYLALSSKLVQQMKPSSSTNPAKILPAELHSQVLLLLAYHDLADELSGDPIFQNWIKLTTKFPKTMNALWEFLTKGCILSFNSHSACSLQSTIVSRLLEACSGTEESWELTDAIYAQLVNIVHANGQQGENLVITASDKAYNVIRAFTTPSSSRASTPISARDSPITA